MSSVKVCSIKNLGSNQRVPVWPFEPSTLHTLSLPCSWLGTQIVHWVLVMPGCRPDIYSRKEKQGISGTYQPRISFVSPLVLFCRTLTSMTLLVPLVVSHRRQYHISKRRFPNWTILMCSILIFLFLWLVTITSVASFCSFFLLLHYITLTLTHPNPNRTNNQFSIVRPGTWRLW